MIPHCSCAANWQRSDFDNQMAREREEFEGERNVLNARNEALERTSKELNAANVKFAQQLEAACQKVQIIAEKTVEGTSQSRSLAELQKLLIEQSRKSTTEKG